MIRDTPKVNLPRSVPIALWDKLKCELENMVKMGVIAKVTEPTEWISSMVIVVKPLGKLQVCLNPRNLNQSVQREHFPMNNLDQQYIATLHQPMKG